jgi:hypothetical protein
MKTFYRVTIQFIDPEFEDVSPSNLFLEDKAGKGPEATLKYAEQIFKEAQEKAGVTGAAFKSEIYPVTQQDIDDYKAQMNKRRNQLMN